MTINQTECEQHILRLDWKKLQNFTNVKKVIFDQAFITFVEDKEKSTGSSLVKLEFYNSNFNELSAISFAGLALVQVFRFVGCNINIIEHGAFSGFQHLKTIEFAHSKVLQIKQEAFSNLPNLKELAFIYSDVFIIETKAISLLDINFSVSERCPVEGVRGRSLIPSSFNGLMDTIMGRSLLHIQNVTFPEHGRNLIFYGSEIRLLSHKSFYTNAFDYIIFGGNEIDTTQSHAFETQFKNRCDISAILFIGNKFNIIKSEAFLGIVGQDGKSYKTAFVLRENTFMRVARKGFSVDENLEILFTQPDVSLVEGNKFSCSCDNFPWILSNEHSDVQTQLEKDLIESGNCIGAFSLLDFLKNCDKPTTTPILKSTPYTELPATTTLTNNSTETEKDYSFVTTEKMVGDRHPTDVSGAFRFKHNIYYAVMYFVLFAICNYQLSI